MFINIIIKNLNIYIKGLKNYLIKVTKYFFSKDIAVFFINNNLMNKLYNNNK